MSRFIHRCFNPAVRASSTSTGRRVAIAIATVVLVAGCGGVSELTKERVARSESSVRQAEQTLGNSESGAVEMQRAKENLDRARRALDDNKEQPAERYAQLAQLDADLAVAKSQSTSARKAADELQASIQSLRREANRSSAAPMPSGSPEPIAPGSHDMPSDTQDMNQDMNQDSMPDDGLQQAMPEDAQGTMRPDASPPDRRPDLPPRP